MANFEAFRRTKKLISNVFFLKSDVVVLRYNTNKFSWNHTKWKKYLGIIFCTILDHFVDYFHKFWLGTFANFLPFCVILSLKNINFLKRFLPCKMVQWRNCQILRLPDGVFGIVALQIVTMLYPKKYNNDTNLMNFHNYISLLRGCL